MLVNNRYVQRIAVRIILVLFTVLLSSCSAINNPEYTSFSIGSDSFDSRSGVFQRSLCLPEKDRISVALTFTESETQELLRLAQLDIRDGNLESGEFDKICVSSYPYEISYGDGNGEIRTTCFSPLRDDEARIANLVYSLKTVQNLPKSSCRLY
jgi:hypothetical protein